MKSIYGFRFFYLVIILWQPLTASAQNGEFGLFLGGSYYNGELNPSKHVIVSQPAAGIFYDLHLNPRYSVRTIFTYGQLEASDKSSEIGLSQFRDLKFEARLLDLSGQIVFNFLEFGNTLNVKPFTPYIFVGLAVFNVNPEVSSLNSDSAGTASPKESYSRSLTSVAMPFGLGFKAIFGSITLGLEWNFRRTFTDSVDGLDNQYDVGNTYKDPIQYNQPSGFQKGSFNTNDWYSLIGLTISYRPKSQKNACPAMD